jgi:hypothetical protein
MAHMTTVDAAGEIIDRIPAWLTRIIEQRITTALTTERDHNWTNTPCAALVLDLAALIAERTPGTTTSAPQPQRADQWTG